MSFKITAGMLNDYCEKGLTVKEMAKAITDASGINCSVNQVKKACQYYNISLRSKPRKSSFSFDQIENVTSNTVENTVGELEMV